MKSTILIALFALFFGGCGIAKHEGKIETFDGRGEPTGTYIATLDTRMFMKVVDPNGLTVEVDSRYDSTLSKILKSAFEFATLGLLVD